MSGSYGVSAAGAARRTQLQVRPAAGSVLPQWFAVQTRYRFEKKVVAQLALKSVEVYLPLLTEHHRWSDRERVVTIPLFPGYLFVRVAPSREAWQAVSQTAGLIGFVSFGSTAAAVPSKQIEDLQLLLREKVPFSVYPFVHTGQRVRIRGGCLHGVEGVLGQYEKGKVIVTIESIQRSLAIEIQGYELEMV